MEIGHLQPIPTPGFTARLGLWNGEPVGWAPEGLRPILGLRAPTGPEPYLQGIFEVAFEAFEDDARPEEIRSVVLQLQVPATAQETAALPWTRLLRAAEALVMAQRRNSIQTWQDSAEEAARAVGKPTYRRKPKGRRPLGYDHYREVAELYEQLCAKGHRAPVAKIAEDYSVGRNTAAAWVSRARKKGLLGPARSGKAG